jgi:hypothetical protein
LEDKSVAKLMAWAKELSDDDHGRAPSPDVELTPSQNGREEQIDWQVESPTTPAAERRSPAIASAKKQRSADDGLGRDLSPDAESILNDNDREVDFDARVRSPKTTSAKRISPTIAAAKKKRNRELIIGFYILLLLGAVVLSVRIFTDAKPRPAELRTGSQPALADRLDQLIQPNSPKSAGLPGAAKAPIRFAEFGCASAACTISCDTSERIVNAFMLDPGATFSYESDRSVTVRPPRLPSGKIVLVCAPQQ